MNSQTGVVPWQVGIVIIASMLVACGSSGDGASASADGSTDAGIQQSVLEQMYPVVENGNFDASGINQSFICIDDADKTYFPLDFSPQGAITNPDTGDSLSYTLNQNKLEINMPAGLSGPVTYQHGYHITAGKLVVGFVGSINDSSSTVTIGCIATNHPYSDAVPGVTTIACRSSSVSDTGTSFNASTTNRFTLEPAHYAQRYFSSRSYESSYSPDGSFSVSTFDETYEHGTYLFDQQSGEYVMGFMKVDFKTPSLDLLVFYGETDGNTVTLSLADQNRGCAFE